ncbi:unnamed protein product [Acanthoscelides obtectus]|uniref:THAP-type domain-containing protein n=1 Tax=Acanthoscelides obtectus TaxID=200917 RepID=A0A9P0PWM4_ACAOB|nr:unnamed protein product [Acanthoscelides obtectus]CAK1653582.1 hypothetical protein AOBTE_LOCUS18295 [Acanthoscelides obtectus]
MGKCFMFGCPNKVADKAEGVSFHRLSKLQLQQLISACGRTGTASNSALVCSDHFTPESFLAVGGKRFLRPSSVIVRKATKAVTNHSSGHGFQIPTAVFECVNVKQSSAEDYLEETEYTHVEYLDPLDRAVDNSQTTSASNSQDMHIVIKSEMDKPDLVQEEVDHQYTSTVKYNRMSNNDIVPTTSKPREIHKPYIKHRLRFKEHDDLALLREILSNNPYENPHLWDVVQENVFRLTGKKFSLKTLKDHAQLLIQQWLNEAKTLEDGSVVQDPYSEKSHLCYQVNECIGEASKKKTSRKSIKQDPASIIVREPIKAAAQDILREDGYLMVEHRYDELLGETDGNTTCDNNESDSATENHKRKFEEDEIIRESPSSRILLELRSTLFYFREGQSKNEME